jgi:hypothetical protein
MDGMDYSSSNFIRVAPGKTMGGHFTHRLCEMAEIEIITFLTDCKISI